MTPEQRRALRFANREPSYLDVSVLALAIVGVVLVWIVKLLLAVMAPPRLVLVVGATSIAIMSTWIVRAENIDAVPWCEERSLFGGSGPEYQRFPRFDGDAHALEGHALARRAHAAPPALPEPPRPLAWPAQLRAFT